MLKSVFQNSNVKGKCEVEATEEIPPERGLSEVHPLNLLLDS